MVFKCCSVSVISIGISERCKIRHRLNTPTVMYSTVHMFLLVQLLFEFIVLLNLGINMLIFLPNRTECALLAKLLISRPLPKNNRWKRLFRSFTAVLRGDYFPSSDSTSMIRNRTREKIACASYFSKQQGSSIDLGPSLRCLLASKAAFSM